MSDSDPKPVLDSKESGRSPRLAVTPCDHCGLPVPAGLIDSSSEQQFCCNGCRAVYAVIHGWGLERFYGLRAATGATGTPAPTTDRRYSEFDDSSFRDLYVRQLSDGTHSVELYLEGVHCAACVWLVEKLPHVVDGVVESRLDMRRSLVQIRWNHKRVVLSRVARALDSLGYPPHPAKDAQARELRRREDHRFLIRIGVAAACAGNVMTLSFALYGGVFSGIEAQYSHFFRLASMAFGLIALAWPGSIFFRGALAALRTRTAHLDLPIALALLAGGLAGTIHAFLGRGDIYFDSLTMLVFLLLVGRWIQRRQQRWANDAVEMLFALTPTSARRLEGERIREVPIEAVKADDVIEIRAGDSVPTDGVILEGTSTLDQSLLTGESLPVAVRPGDNVHAGTVNIGARLTARVCAVGDQTRVGKLVQLVEECSRRRAPIVQFADRVAGWFVLVVVALAVVTFCLWLWKDPSRAVENSVALLIVTCPCALGLATPLAVTVALGRAARRHILIKGGDTLERLARRGTMLLDKTGTITAGRMSVVSFFGDEQVKPLVMALESHSSHPIARAIVAAFDERAESGGTTSRPANVPVKHTDVKTAEGNSSLADLTSAVKQTTGAGLVGDVAGRHAAIGSPRFVRSQNVSISAEMEAAENELVSAARTPVLVAVDGDCVAVIGVGDPVRDDVNAALSDLKRLGWESRVLSGDHPEVVASVARELGIPLERAVGGATPEDKVAYVQARAATECVVMVGDGVNDAAALSAATVGVAVHGGAEASLAAADVYLNRSGLTPIVELVQASRSTLRTIRRSLIVSLCYNTVAASLAIAGLIGPLVAAILMPVSSFTVLALALTSRTFRDPT